MPDINVHQTVDDKSTHTRVHTTRWLEQCAMKKNGTLMRKIYMLLGAACILRLVITVSTSGADTPHIKVVDN